MAAYGGQSHQRWGDNTVSANESIRDLQLTDQNGRTCHTGQARGKGMLVLAFICPNSPESVSVLQAMQKLDTGYKESGKLTVWPIVVGGDEGAVTAAVAAAGWTGSVLRDREGYHSMTYGIPYGPCAFLVDRTGIVQRRVLGWNADAFSDISARIAAFAEIETPVEIA